MFVFVSYMIKVSMSLAFFYMLYKLLLNQDANHKYKRLTLLISVLAAFLIPLLGHLIPTNEIASAPLHRIQEFIEQPLVINQAVGDIPIADNQNMNDTSPTNWTILVYFLVIIALCFRLIISYRSIFKWIRKATIKPYKNILLAIVNEAIQAFSFSKYIVLSKQDYEDNKTAILLHEEAHIKLHHSIDVVLMELVCYLQWFNPFAWLLKKELKLVHEFQADQAVLNTGIDATQYQLLILEKAVGKRRFASVNLFKQGPISKRLKMMKKKQIKGWSVAKALLFIPAGFLLLQAFTQPEIIKEVNKLPPLIIQADSSQIWLSHWTLDNLPQSINTTVTKRSSMAEKGTETVESKIIKKNVLQILQNRLGAYLVNGQVAKKDELEAIVKSFIQGKDYWGKTGPEVEEIRLPDGNKTRISKGIISFIYDRGTKKSDFDFTLKALGKAHLEARKEKAQSVFNKAYFQLDKTERSHIDRIVPIRISKLAPPPIRNRRNSSNVPNGVAYPQVKHASNASIIEIRVTNDGIFLNGKECPVEQISEKLKPIMAKNPNSVVSLKADSETKMGIITDLKVQLRLAGALKLNYSTTKH